MRDSERNRKEAMDEEDIPLEKNDMFAMNIAGFLVIGIPCLVMILIIMAVVLIFFGGK